MRRTEGNTDHWLKWSKSFKKLLRKYEKWPKRLEEAGDADAQWGRELRLGPISSRLPRTSEVPGGPRKSEVLGSPRKS